MTKKISILLIAVLTTLFLTTGLFAAGRTDAEIIHVEIAGINTIEFGDVVNVQGSIAKSYSVPADSDYADTRITLTLRYRTTSALYTWYSEFYSKALQGGRDISILAMDAGGNEISRHNLFDCEPVDYKIIYRKGKMYEQLVLSHSQSNRIN